MKTKLLKKIRKQYSIVYYPNRKVYEIEGYWNDITGMILESGLKRGNSHFKDNTLQGAKDKLLKILKIEYNKYSKQYKLNQVKEKVWYNS